MDLLNNLRATALDPSYPAAVAGRGAGRARRGVLLPAMIVVGMLFGVALGQTWRTAPAAAQERDDLVARIMAEESRIDEARTLTAALEREIQELGRSSGALSVAEQERVDVLASLVGTAAVSGPGVRITLDDGADADVQGSRVVDADLRMVTNSLWALGAEAVSVNGHRLSSRTAIRNAGDAITVDYRSIIRPYVVEAIGDARALEEGFPASEGGQWVEGLSQHFGVGWALTRVDTLDLAADPGLGVELATGPS